MLPCICRARPPDTASAGKGGNGAFGPGQLRGSHPNGDSRGLGRFGWVAQIPLPNAIGEPSSKRRAACPIFVTLLRAAPNTAPNMGQSRGIPGPKKLLSTPSRRPRVADVGSLGSPSGARHPQKPGMLRTAQNAEPGVTTAGAGQIACAAWGRIRTASRVTPSP